jgi:aryl-alcohol dehydrogenase-like predicted oxidoreductase
MNTIQLKSEKDTLEMTKLVIGDNGISQEDKRELAHWVFDHYLEAGGNTFDSARLYGGGLSEEFLGKYLKGKPRDSYLISTKGGHHDGGKPPKGTLTREILTKEIETSLKLLQTDYVDVYFLHRDDIFRPVEEIMPILSDFVKEGKVRFLGASNWTAGRIAKANRFSRDNGLAGFSISQICWNLGLTTSAETGDLTHIVMDLGEYLWYKENNFPVMAWTAAARGYFSKADPSTSRGYSYYGYLKENQDRAKRVQTLAKELNVPVNAVVLSYLMSDTNIPGLAITSCSNQDQFRESIQSASLVLSPEQRSFLSGGLPV